MGFYLFAGLVFAFIGVCIFFAFKWEVESFRSRKGSLQNNKKHDKETTATSATDIASTPPGLEITGISHPAFHNTSAAGDMWEKDADMNTANNDSDHTDSNSADNSGSYSGGYDSGGGSS